MGSKAQILCDKLVETFSKEPEVWKIETWGKIVEGISDSYSDVDIRIISKDPYLTQQKVHSIIEKEISLIRQTFPFLSNENKFTEMIMLRDYSPYQKIDMSVERDGFGVQFSPIITTFQNDSAKGLDRDCKVYDIKKTVDYDLMNVLFGIPRTTKCFFRKDFDIYRRWESLTDALLIILNEKYMGWQLVNEEERVRAHVAKVLYKRMTKEDILKLKKVFPSDGMVDISESYINALNLYLEIAHQKAKAQNITFDEEFIKYMMNFAEEEVRRFKQ